MPVVVPASGFRQQVEEFAKQLAYLTEVVEVADDERTPIRATSYLVQIPDARSGVTTTLDYREEFRRTDGGWTRTRYWYELRVSRPNTAQLHSRRAHHQHQSWGIHQHCQTPTRLDDHYADVERLLQATHELFVKRYAASSPIDCAGLVPLAKP